MSTKTGSTTTKAEKDLLNRDKKMAKDRPRRQKRLNWLFHLLFGFVCAGFVAILAIMHFFIGVSQVFEVNFSLPTIVNWLTSLFEVPVVKAEEQLARLIIGILFFIVYFIISIKIIKALVKIIHQISLLNDAKYGKISPRKALFTTFEQTSISYCGVLSFGLVASTSSKGIHWGVIVLLVLYGIFFIAASLKNSIDGRKLFGDVEFKKQSIVGDIIKDILLVVFAGALVALWLQPQILIISQNIGLNFQQSQGFKGFELVERFVFPSLKFLLSVTSTLLLGQALLISGRSSSIKNIAFYGEIYRPKKVLTFFQKKAKKRMGRIIWLSILCCLLSLFLAFFTGQGFAIPEDIMGLVVSHLNYPISIVLAIFTYILLKRREDRISEFQEKK